MRAITLTLLLNLLAGTTHATTWQIGPTREHKMPSAVAKLVQPGDTVEIDAGVYDNDYVTWRQDNLVIRGVGGMAHLRSKGLIPNGKAIWIVRGENTLIENIEFSGARVQDTNGAGLRQNGGSLTVNNSYFHDNQFAILAASKQHAELTVLNSRFAGHRRDQRFAHTLYIGAIRRFTLSGSHITDTAGGHHVKSRALQNHILYNRIEDAPQTTSARMLDLSNCGLSIVIGNEFYQGKKTENSNAIGYGAEECEGRSGRLNSLYVTYNTLVNDGLNATLVRNHSGGQVMLGNNLLVGRGKFLTGVGELHGNIGLSLKQWQRAAWLPEKGAQSGPTALPEDYVYGMSLLPQRVFVAPAGTAARGNQQPGAPGARSAAQ
jgi:hypothetical protein